MTKEKLKNGQRLLLRIEELEKQHTRLRQSKLISIYGNEEFVFHVTDISSVYNDSLCKWFLNLIQDEINKLKEEFKEL